MMMMMMTRIIWAMTMTMKMTKRMSRMQIWKTDQFALSLSPQVTYKSHLPV